jgi:hypothetical protein
MADPPPIEAQDQEKQVIRIWDAPESRITFLETVLKNKEWEAVIYHPDFAPDGTQKQGAATPLPELEQSLRARGYKTALGQDANGIPTLSVHNFGADTSLATAVKELGFAKGVTRKLSNIGEPLGNAISKTADMIQYITGDKARLIGGIYLVGNMMMAASGWANRRDNAPKEGIDPAKLLQSMSGITAVLQSLVYMRFAKKGGDAMYEQLMSRAATASEQGQDILDSHVWREQVQDKPKGLLHSPKQLLENYPIQIGAALQLAGQLALMSSGGIRLQRGKGATGAEAEDIRQGALGDIRTVLLSITGWTLLTKKESKNIADEDKHPWTDPRRIWQEMSESPNKFASGFFSAASLSGIAAGYKKGNPMQMAANSTYLMGDSIMYATKSDDYGVTGMRDSTKLAEAAQRFVETSPSILGQAEQRQLVDHLSAYLAERSLYEESEKTKRPVTEESVSDLTERIAKNLNAMLPSVNKRTNEAAGRIADIASTFHPDLGVEVIDSLCAAICEMPGVHIGHDELKAHATRQLHYPQDLPDNSVKMKDIAQPMADLLFAVPGAATPESVNMLYSAIEGYLHSKPIQSQTVLEETINNTAVRDIRGATQKMPSPVAGLHSANVMASRMHSESVQFGR